MSGKLLIAAALLAAAPAVALAKPDPTTAEARIYDMARNIETIVDPRRGIYIRDYAGRWFYASVDGNSCPRLTRNASLRFEASPGGYFDRYSAIRADGWRCVVESVMRSDGPPWRAHRR